jgi:hypothetical protein
MFFDSGEPQPERVELLKSLATHFTCPGTVGDDAQPCVEVPFV